MTAARDRQSLPPSRRTVLIWGCATGIGLVGAGTAGTGNAEPEGLVVLTVDGPGEAPPYLFDRAMLAALPQVEFTTTTLWTPEPLLFTGPTLLSVLQAAGAGPGRIVASAANDYRIEIDRRILGAEFPIVAHMINGRPFGLRERGPLWIIFPFDGRPELRTETIYAQSIWQLTKLTIVSP